MQRTEPLPDVDIWLPDRAGRALPGSETIIAPRSARVSCTPRFPIAKRATFWRFSAFVSLSEQPAFHEFTGFVFGRPSCRSGGYFKQFYWFFPWIIFALIFSKYLCFVFEAVLLLIFTLKDVLILFPRRYPPARSWKSPAAASGTEIGREGSGEMP